MEDLQSIDYRVDKASEFMGHVGQDINRIGQKSSKFTFVGESPKFMLTLKLRVPAIVVCLDYKVQNTSQLHFDFYHADKLVCSNQVLLKGKAGGDVGIFRLKQASGICDRVQIGLINVPDPKESTIHYILVKGHKQDSKTPAKIKNVSKNDEEFKPSIKPVGEKHSVFNERKKKASPAELEREAIELDFGDEKRQKKKTLLNNPDFDLKKAIELSKKEEQRKRKEVESFIYDLPVTYQICEYTETIKKVYEHVTPEWLEAQLRAEKLLNVQPRHSLGAKIKPKVLKNMKFCISGIYGEEKKKLLMSIKEMGGQCIENPQDNCVVVSNKADGKELKMSKTMKGVKCVVPDYIYNCLEFKAKLLVSDYELKGKF